MKFALVGAVALALVLGAGTASGDTFSVVSTSDPPIFFQAGGVAGLPSAQVPNIPGELVLPIDWTAQAGIEAPVSSADLESLWKSAGAAYGVPWQVLAAINKIESNFGRNMGPSSAGAIGWMQFMPDTWMRWGADFSGDGVADPWNARDAVYSAARYLAAAGGASDISRAVLAYNHAQWYVNEVLSLAQTLSRDGSLSFSLDDLQASLEQAETKVATLNQKIAGIRTRAGEIRARADRMFARADRAPLITQRSALRMQAGDVQNRAVALEAQLPALESSLADAQGELDKARSNAQTQSFDPGTAVYLASPQYQNGYVFPVGGGPSKVSVGHTHHDYPAADIAAPQGSPVYALADGVVARTWNGIDPLCGIGMDFRTDDGQTWAYCHLSYKEPTIVTGARLTAGQSVGLVGMTGHATGPHLHLGLIPSSQGYPQSEAWFQSFAGIAFRWQDAPTPSVPVDSYSQSQPVVFSILSDTGGNASAVANSWSVVDSTSRPARTLGADAAPAPVSPFAPSPASTGSTASSGANQPAAGLTKTSPFGG